MKPNFILDLTQDGIRLRDAGEDKNAVLGEVRLSEPDFEEKVAALRNAVAEKSDLPLATELRIPDSEILYTTLDDPEFDAKTAKGSRDELREKLVRDALEGMTPYALSDLNYIWKVKGKGELAIAAVAHETLAEAEEFAASRGFNPLRFTAQPGAEKFKGTADFGPTRTQRARTAAQAQAAAEKARAEAEAAALQRAEAEALRKAEAAKAKAEAAPPPIAQGSVLPADAASPPVKDEAAAKADSPESASANTKPDPAPKAAPLAESAPATPPPAAPPGKAAKPKASVAPAATASAPPAGDTPRAGPPEKTTVDAPRVGFSQPRVNDPLPPLDDGGVLNDVPPMPAISFASRRKPGDRPALATGARANGSLSPGVANVDGNDGNKDSRLSRIAARFAVAPGADSLAKAAVPPPPPRRTPAAAAGADGKPALRGSADKPGIAGRPGPDRTAPAGALPDTTAAAASLTPPGDTGMRLPETPYRPRQTEAEAMTVFGARTAPPRRSFAPLIIGIAVVAALAIAIWAAFLLLGDEQVTGETGALLPQSEATLEQPGAPDITSPDLAEAERAPEPAPEPAPETTVETAAVPLLPRAQPDADTSGAALPETTGATDTANGRISAPDSTVATLGPLAPAAPLPEASIVSQAPPPPLANDLLQRPPAGDADSNNVVGRYATTGVWVEPPGTPGVPDTDRLDDMYIAAIDPAIRQPANPGVASLPTLSAPVGIMPQLPPAGPGQTFDLDERGLVRATPEGAMTPDGIVITAGTPPRRPPPTPARPDTLAPTDATQPDLPRTRPRDRPGNLAGDIDESGLSVPVNSQAAAVLPRARPEDLAPTGAHEPALTTEDAEDPARAAALAVAGASTATPQAPLSTRPPRPAPANLAALRPAPTPEPEPAPEPEVVAAAPVAPVSPYAVARSRLPKARPGNIERIAAQARARAPAVQEQPQVTRVAAPAAVTTPSIPSRASVAKQATVKNAINLGRINLIGVYGSNSNRSALVRLPSGKFITLKVGDRVDGGRVAAISQSQLSYHKGGRQVVLSMPKG